MQRQVESMTSNGLLFPVNVESSLLFETPNQLYARVFQTLRPRTALPAIRVEYRRFAGANSNIRLSGGEMVVRIADLLEGAPAPVAEALAFILVSKLFRRPVEPVYPHRYRMWLNRAEVRRQVHLVRQLRGRKLHDGPEGKSVHLEELFDELNVRHFNGLMARPAIGWSRRVSRTRLGHYDPSHNAIVLSRVLDGPHVPRLVVEYVMFHEMLHLRYPEQHRGSRRCVHTREFKQAEKQFPELTAALAALKRLLA
ncbi:MAG: SprT-like domain-containing protein [Acidobacteria bacterium]|nr:SprT-like domain-containing protein [Acidobacteriota bacterium]